MLREKVLTLVQVSLPPNEPELDSLSFNCSAWEAVKAAKKAPAKKVAAKLAKPVEAAAPKAE